MFTVYTFNHVTIMVLQFRLAKAIFCYVAEDAPTCVLHLERGGGGGGGVGEEPPLHYRMRLGEKEFTIHFDIKAGTTKEGLRTESMYVKYRE